MLLLIPTLVGTAGASALDVENNTRWFANLEERSDGSIAEKEAFDYIASHLDSLRLSYTRIPLNPGRLGHTFSENLAVEFPGTRPNHFVLATPVDGGAFSTSLLMEMASRWASEPPNNTVILVFLGAEKGESRFHPYGSRQAVEAYNFPGDTFALYIKSEEIPDSWSLKPGGGGKVAPHWLVKSVSQAFSAATIPYRLKNTDIEVAKMGLQGDIGPLQTWIDADISTMLIEGNVSGEKDRRMIQRFLRLLSDIDSHTIEVPTNPQSVFFFFRPLSNFAPRFIPELSYVSVFLAVSALLMVIILLRFRTISLNIKRFFRFWWTWPMLFAMVFLFLFLSTLIVEETIIIADFPLIWTYAPGVFVFFKITIAAALSMNLILIARGFPLARNPHFYSYSAILTAIAASLVFIALNITLAIYSLWALIILFLFISTRKLHWKYVYLTLSLIPYIAGLVLIVNEPYMEVIEVLLLNRTYGSLILTLLLYPIVLALTSLHYHRPHYEQSRTSALTSIATFLFALPALITLIWVLNLNPFDRIKPQPVSIIDHINLNADDRRIKLVSPAPIGDIELQMEGRVYQLEALDRSAELRMPLTGTPLSINSESRVFLGRRTIRSEISGEENPKRLKILLSSSNPYTLHEANFPFEMAPSGTLAEIFIGENPPFPISLRFTVNNDASLILSVVGTWTDPLAPPSIEGENLEGQSSRVVQAEAKL